MALEWEILGYVAATEAVMLILLILPGPEPPRKVLIFVIKTLLQPFPFIVPFFLLLLLEIYWKYYKTALSCDSFNSGQKCLMLNQRNGLLIASALLLYWVLYSFTNLVVRVDELKRRIQMLENSE